MSGENFDVCNFTIWSYIIPTSIVAIQLKSNDKLNPWQSKNIWLCEQINNECQLGAVYNSLSGCGGEGGCATLCHQSYRFVKKKIVLGPNGYVKKCPPPQKKKPLGSKLYIISDDRA